MSVNEYTITWTKGQGPGGQHKNKVANCCVLTHVPTGTVVKVDGRSRTSNLKEARLIMSGRLEDLAAEQKAAKRKADRDRKIKDNTRVRTYDYTKGGVVDHRTGKKASIKDVVEKGLIDKLR